MDRVMGVWPITLTAATDFFLPMFRWVVLLGGGRFSGGREGMPLPGRCRKGEAMGHKLKVGDIVEVFQDPVTQMESEGVAKIVELMDVPDYYRVRFLDEYEQTYLRFIYSEKTVDSGGKGS